MRKTKAHARRRARSTTSYSTLFKVGPVLLVVAAFLIIFVLAQSPLSSTAGASAPEPTKPQGTITSNPPTTEKWTVAKGLPTKVMRLAFSAADANRGYASVF